MMPYFRLIEPSGSRLGCGFGIEQDVDGITVQSVGDQAQRCVWNGFAVFFDRCEQVRGNGLTISRSPFTRVCDGIDEIPSRPAAIMPPTPDRQAIGADWLGVVECHLPSL